MGACNSLLGLDGAVPDSDHDAVADAIDNCPFDPNPQQRDRDGNGLGDVCDCAAAGADLDADGVDDACDDCVGEATGADVGGDGIDDGCEVCAAATGTDMDGDGVDDACDPCPLGPDHDEDHDGVADACDNCPTQPNPDQRSTPGETLGDACARGGLRTAAFDPFVEQDVTLWPGIVPGWSWIDDGVTITGSSSRTTKTRGGPEFLMETRASSNVDIVLFCSSGPSLISCTLDAARKLTLLVSEFGQAQVTVTSEAVPGTEPVRFRFGQNSMGTSCEAIDATGAVLVAAQSADTGPCATVKVVSNGTSRLDYLWIATK